MLPVSNFATHIGREQHQDPNPNTQIDVPMPEIMDIHVYDRMEVHVLLCAKKTNARPMTCGGSG